MVFGRKPESGDIFNFLFPSKTETGVIGDKKYCLGLCSATSSENSNDMDFPENWVLPLIGTAATSLGAVLSLGPPSGAFIEAQELSQYSAGIREKKSKLLKINDFDC